MLIAQTTQVVVGDQWTPTNVANLIIAISGVLVGLFAGIASLISILRAGKAQTTASVAVAENTAMKEQVASTNATVRAHDAKMTDIALAIPNAGAIGPQGLPGERGATGATGAAGQNAVGGNS